MTQPYYIETSFDAVPFRTIQHNMLLYTKKLNNVINKDIIDKTMSWPSYTWYRSGNRFIVSAYGFVYERDRKESATARSIGCYEVEIFATHQEKIAIFSVELFKRVFNSASASRHGWNPKAKTKLVVLKPIRSKKVTTKQQNKITHGKPMSLTNEQWNDLLGWIKRPFDVVENDLISTSKVVDLFVSWIEDVEKFNTIAIEGVTKRLEVIRKHEKENDMNKVGPLCYLLAMDIRKAVSSIYNREG